MVLVCDEMERHPNPLAMLREVGRILAPGTPMAIVSRRRRPTEDAALDPEHRYPWPLLLRQVDMVGGLKLLTEPNNDNARRDMILVARRKLEVRAGAA